MISHKKTNKTETVMSNSTLLWVGLLAFALTLATCVTGTYAWFSVSDSGKVSMAEFKINENGDFKIGIKGDYGYVDYYSNVDDTTLAAYHSQKYQPGGVLEDVSSMYQSLWLDENTDLKTVYPVLRRGYGTNNNKESYVATSGYYQFEFYFKSDRDMYIFLDKGGTEYTALHDLNKLYADSVNAEAEKDPTIAKVDVDDLDNVVHSVRTSFLSEDGFRIFEPNATASSETSYGGLIDISPLDGYYDYDPSTNKEIVYGEYADNAPIIYDSILEEDVVEPGKQTTFNAKHKKGVAPVNLEKSYAAGLTFAKEKTYTLDQLGIGQHDGAFDPDTQFPLLTLKANTPKRLVVTTYIEGWDHDTVPSIGNAKFMMKLGFRGLVAPISD